MSVDSDHTSIVVEQRQSIISYNDSEDDDVFINPDALLMEPSRPVRSRTTPSTLSTSAQKSKTFVKLIKTVQFVRKWAGRAERPSENRHESLADRLRLSRPSIQSMSSVVEYERPRHRLLSWLSRKKLRQRMVWNPNGLWLL